MRTKRAFTVKQKAFFIIFKGISVLTQICAEIHSMKGQIATTRHGVTRKRTTKRLKDKGNLFRKSLQLQGLFQKKKLLLLLKQD